MDGWMINYCDILLVVTSRPSSRSSSHFRESHSCSKSTRLLNFHQSTSASMPDIHLAVLIHGLHGNPGNLAQCEIELVKAHQEKRSQSKQGNGSDLDLQVFIPSTFPGTLTFDGVELLAIRVADELDKKIERIGSQGGDVKAISIVSFTNSVSPDDLVY
jgi:hypothetical protein